MRHSSVKKFHCLDLETIKKWPLTRSSFDKQNGHQLYFFNLKKKGCLTIPLYTMCERWLLGEALCLHTECNKETTKPPNGYSKDTCTKSSAAQWIQQGPIQKV